MNEYGLRHFEDYVPGASYDCGSVSFDQAGIITFAKEFDPQPFHVDPVAAADGPFGGLIASGWHTTAVVMRLLVENYLPPGGSLGGPGVDEIRWPNPVRPGDTVRVRATVMEARKSQSRPDRGIVKTMAEAVNSGGQPVMRVTAVNFIAARPPGGA